MNRKTNKTRKAPHLVRIYYISKGEIIMKIAVRYYSRGGNTKKVAEAIAKAVGVEAKTVSEPLTEDVDILFLGSSPYAFDVDDEVKKFISGINVSVGKAVNFSTSAAIKSTKNMSKSCSRRRISRWQKRNFPAVGRL